MGKIFKSLVTLSLILAVLITGCTSPEDMNPPTSTPIPIVDPSPNQSPTHPSNPTSPPPTSSPVPPSATPIILDTGWIALQPGIKRRIVNLLGPENDHVEQVYALLINPNGFTFNLHYDPKARTLEDWQLQTNALVVFNGGFFRFEDNIFIPNGLTIIEGEKMGSSYGPFAGMFAVTEGGPELRWLNHRAYDPSEHIFAALQSFPMLVKPGGELGFGEENEDNLKARRSVIGLTKKGEFVFIIASKGHFTLHQLSSYLVESDFDLDIALNLDGGPSSGLLVSSPYEVVPSYIPLPIVITVKKR